MQTYLARMKLPNPKEDILFNVKVKASSSANKILSYEDGVLLVSVKAPADKNKEDDLKRKIKEKEKELKELELLRKKKEAEEKALRKKEESDRKKKEKEEAARKKKEETKH